MSENYTPQTDNRRQVFDVFAEIATLPSDSESMLADAYAVRGACRREVEWGSGYGGSEVFKRRLRNDAARRRA